jgi:hypothetical protein
MVPTFGHHIKFSLAKTAFLSFGVWYPQRGRFFRLFFFYFFASVFG